MHTSHFTRFALSPRTGLTARLALAAGTAALALSLAQPAAAADGPLMQMLSSGDGSITRSKVETALREQFARLDTNHDGQLSESEFVDSRLKMFDQADQDGDGKLEFSEMRSAAIKHLTGTGP